MNSSLSSQAVMIATEVFGDKHPKYADTLIDYGFYLLNVDAISQGVQVYQVSSVPDPRFYSPLMPQTRRLQSHDLWWRAFCFSIVDGCWSYGTN